jgi:hypothetical protein
MVLVVDDRRKMTKRLELNVWLRGAIDLPHLMAYIGVDGMM